MFPVYNLYILLLQPNLIVLVSYARNRKQKPRLNQKLTSLEEIFSKISSFIVKISRKFISSNFWFRRVFLILCTAYDRLRHRTSILLNCNSIFFSDSIEKPAWTMSVPNSKKRHFKKSKSLEKWAYPVIRCRLRNKIFTHQNVYAWGS